MIILSDREIINTYDHSLRKKEKRMNDSELKTCPFCGGKAKMISTGFGMGTFYVMCVNERCEVSPATKYYYEEEDAAKAWNKRESTPLDVTEKMIRMDTLINTQRDRISEINETIDDIRKKLDILKELKINE